MYRLLIVDDESAVRARLTKLVDWRGLGFEAVATARDGLSARQIARSTRPDVAIVDVRMPRADGIALSEWLRSESPGTEIIFLSGFDEKPFLKAAIRLGAVEFLEKPVSKDALTRAVSTALRRVDSSRASGGGAGGAHGARGAGPGAEDQDALLEAGLQGERLEPRDVAALLARTPALSPCRSLACLLVYADPRAADKAEHRRRLAEIAGLMETSYARRGRPVRCALAGDCVLLVVGFADGGESVQEIAGRLLDRAAPPSGGPGALAVAAGESVQHPTDLPRSYRGARLAAERIFLQGYGRLFTPRGPRAVAVDEAGLAEHAEALRSASERFDGQEAARVLDSVTGWLKSQEGLTRDAVLRLLLRLFENSHQALRSAGGTEESTEEYHETIWRIITRSQTLDDAVHELRSWISAAISRIRHERRFTRPVVETMRYVQSNLAGRISLREAAAAASVSPSYLSRAFREQTGVKFSQYVIRLRLERAAMLLDRQALKVYQVAEAVGYPDYRHFERLFRRKHGMSPTAFVRRAGADGAKEGP